MCHECEREQVTDADRESAALSDWETGSRISSVDATSVVGSSGTVAAITAAIASASPVGLTPPGTGGATAARQGRWAGRHWHVGTWPMSVTMHTPEQHGVRSAHGSPEATHWLFSACASSMEKR